MRKTSLVVGLGFTLLSSPLFAQAPPPLEHFQCYVVLRAEPPFIEPVRLLDQFNDPEVVDVVRARRFCNPVRKAHRGLIFPVEDIRQHLMFYATFPQSAPVRFVALSNQFNAVGAASQVWVLREAVALAVPTRKLPHEAPVGLDHFRCYAASGPQTFEQVRLDDQFLPPSGRVVLNPVLFCNPVQKTRDDGEVTPVVNPDAHLACYSTTRVPFTTTRQVVNQFGQFAIAVGPPDTLCVPTRKLGFVTIPDGPIGAGAPLLIDK